MIVSAGTLAFIARRARFSCSLPGRVACFSCDCQSQEGVFAVPEQPYWKVWSRQRGISDWLSLWGHSILGLSQLRTKRLTFNLSESLCARLGLSTSKTESITPVPTLQWALTHQPISSNSQNKRHAETTKLVFLLRVNFSTPLKGALELRIRPSWHCAMHFA